MSFETRTAKVEAELAAAESAFRATLLRLLPMGVSRGVDYFTNSEFSQHPKGIVRPNAEAEALLTAARRCLMLRTSLSLPVESSLAQVYIAACQEAGSANEHRRGPRRLAEAVLAQAQHDAA
jgi:hypothetical protein